MNSVLEIENLHVETLDGKKILNGLDLEVKQGEIHAIMGPNGSGKSTFAQSLMGSPAFKVTQGKIFLAGKDITDLPPDEKAREGIFLGFQNPVEIPGVNFAGFLRLAVNERSKGLERISPLTFRSELTKKSKELNFEDDIIRRTLNEGFSGGEKKKSEVIQLAFLKPKFAILDEPDSGLDVDALRYISKMIKKLEYPIGLVIISHYQRIFRYLRPDFVHILVKGQISESGDGKLVSKVEKKGYEQYI